MKKYKNRKWLILKYHKEQMTLEEIAAECDVVRQTIIRYMDMFDIKRRKRGWSKEVKMSFVKARMATFLYDTMQLFCKKKKINTSELIRLAVFEYMLKRRFNPFRSNGEMITTGEET